MVSFQTKQESMEVHVELLDEGTTTWRPTTAKSLGNGLFELQATQDYDPEEEAWAFLPGDIVRLEEMEFTDGRIGLVARHSDPNVVRINVESDDAFSIRTTNALSLGEGLYEILPTPHYDANKESWKFPPTSVVRLEEKEWPGGTFLVAVEI